MARAADLPSLLATLVRQVIPDRGAPMANPDELMQDVVEQDMDRQARDERQGQASVFTCPGCGGALWQIRQPVLIQFRCHVGHVYNADILLSEQSEALEAALWTAVRTFREKSILAPSWPTTSGPRGTTTPPPDSRSKPGRPPGTAA